MTISEINILKTLDFNKQIAFAYLACERLYPNYVYFSENFHFGNAEVLKEAIDFIADSIFEKKKDNIKIDLLLRKVDKNTPHTENFTTHFVSSALDACTSIEDSLHFLIDKDFSRIENISTYAIDSVHMYIQEIANLDFNTDKNFQLKITNHPLMKKEVAIQSGIVTFLKKNNKSLDWEDLQTLLRLQSNEGRGNLDV